MGKAKQGDTVAIHYTGRLEDGTVFDTSRDRDPLELTLGSGQVIPGFEKAVEGMAEGDTKTEKIPSEEAYGPRRDDMVLSLPKEQLPEHLDPAVGQQLQMQSQEGQVFEVTVVGLDEEKIEIDANHPLAGKDLTFDLELVKVGE